MIKNNKGVTLVLLIVTIVVLMMLVTVTVNTGKELLKNSERDRLKSSLYLIKARAETLYESYLFDFENPLSDEITDQEKAEYLGGSVVNNSAEIKSVRFFEGENYIFCKWNLDDLKKQGISTDKYKEDDTFIIQYDANLNEVDVAFYRGFKYNNKLTYYRLSELP